MLCETPLPVFSQLRKHETITLTFYKRKYRDADAGHGCGGNELNMWSHLRRASLSGSTSAPAPAQAKRPL